MYESEQETVQMKHRLKQGKQADLQAGCPILIKSIGLSQDVL